MTVTLNRPVEPTAACNGLMRKEQFQTGYVTNDLDQACKVLGERYGIDTFSFIDGEMPDGGQVRVAFAWVGGNMYEIIHAKGGRDADFYTNRLPKEGFGLVFHHLGYMIHSQEEWDTVKAEIAERNMQVVMDMEAPDFMNAIYIEAPELGHYLEYIFPAQAGLDFFDAVPVNGE